MTISKDPFQVDVHLLHPSYSPEDISNALGIKPQGSWAAGTVFGKLRMKKSMFRGRLVQGDYVSDYEAALAKVILFLKKHESFWTEFIGGQGEVEIVLNHTVYRPKEEGSISSELYLGPAFLEHLSGRGIGLRIRGWSGKIEK